ncbi:MAG: acylneuraminate cytidylyltransferase family protein [Ruminococcus sp.]|nr:acylneuraminate cytidylyltransferase family protein [Ruminococcus sp.]
MKTVAVIPIKMNNQRTPGKNTRPLSDGTPLIHLIQKTLLECTQIDEVYVYCSTEEIKNYLLPGVKYLKRSSQLDTAETSMNTILKCFSEDVDSDIYVLSHATAPFLSAASIEKAVNAVKSGKYDSAFSVEKMYDFFWKGNAPLNYSLDNIPRTQDMEPFIKETSGVYVFTGNIIREHNRRIGDSPCMVEVSEIEAIDIDTPDDFMIADAVYSYMHILQKANCTTGGGITNNIC